MVVPASHYVVVIVIVVIVVEVVVICTLEYDEIHIEGLLLGLLLSLLHLLQYIHEGAPIVTLGDLQGSNPDHLLGGDLSAVFQESIDVVLRCAPGESLREGCGARSALGIDVEFFRIFGHQELQQCLLIRFLLVEVKQRAFAVVSRSHIGPIR